MEVPDAQPERKLNDLIKTDDVKAASDARAEERAKAEKPADAADEEEHYIHTAARYPFVGSIILNPI